MALLPKGSSKTAFATTLSAGALVMYENDSDPILAIVIQFRKNRYAIFNDRGRELEIDPVRIHELPGRAPANLASAQDRVQFLTQLMSTARAKASEVSLSELWEFVKDDPRNYLTADLAKLYLGDDSLPQHLALRLALLQAQTYFKRQREYFVPRSAEQVEELTRVARAADERRRKEKVTIEFFKLRLHDPALPIPDEARDTLRLLEDIAVDAAHLDNSRQKEVKELLDQSASILGLQPQGRAPERAFSILLKIAHFCPDQNLALLRHRPPIQFSEKTRENASQIDLFAARGDKSRRDLTTLACVTIDDDSTKDMDDALSLEKSKDGYTLGIHISDVAALVAPETAVEEEAKRRATSIYLPDRTIHMLPEVLSEDRASLRAGEIRPTLSCIIRLTQQLEIENFEIVPSIIKVHTRLNYVGVDDHLEQRVAVDSPVSLDLLFQIAMNQQTYRISRGASMMQKKEVIPVVNARGEARFDEIDEESPARSLIAEMMVLANRLCAEFAASHGLPLIFRGQEPPDAGYDEVQDMPEGTPRDYALRARLKRSVSGTKPMPHSTLGLSAYAQVTSPIRRYSDLCNQRQLISFLKDGKGYYSHAMLSEILKGLEEPLATAMAVSKETRRYWLLKFLALRSQTDPLIEGTVVRIDLKNPLVELDHLYSPFFVKCEETPRLGSRIKARIIAVHPHSDYVRLERVA